MLAYGHSVPITELLCVRVCCVGKVGGREERGMQREREGGGGGEGYANTLSTFQ